tara:strand:- start:439 stop:834 length:396 start_codon:yes stop_codon:yes gene_type:complete
MFKVVEEGKAVREVINLEEALRDVSFYVSPKDKVDAAEALRKSGKALIGYDWARASIEDLQFCKPACPPTSQTSDLEYADYLDGLAEDFEADGYEQTATDIAGAALRIKFLVAELKGRNVLLDAYRKRAGC